MKQFILYGIIGVCTTAINYLIFAVSLPIGWLAANSLAWVGAVIFAYVANQKIVFKQDGSKTQFFLLRLATLLLENLLLWCAIDWIHFNPIFSKVMVSFVTIIANYVVCQSIIFVNKKEVLA